jgi:hypothetical protein
MSQSGQSAQRATGSTEITLVSGERRRVQGDPKEIEQTILDAARGSIMQFAWLVDADTGEDVAINPEHVVLLRAAAPSSG